MNAVEKNKPVTYLDAQRSADARETPLLHRVIVELNAAGAPYCYWKSTSKLDRVMRGETDLDLLVPRRARSQFVSVLTALGFKPWPDVDVLNQPEFVSYLGFDETTGTIAHVHAHFRLLLGDTVTKTFRLPIEEDLVLRSVVHDIYPLRVLDPVDEALLLRLRDALQGGWLDVLARRRRKLEEAPFPLATPAEAAAIQARAETFLSPPVARSLAGANSSDTVSARALRGELRRELRPWRLEGRLGAGMRAIHRTAYLALSAINRKTLQVPRLGRRRAPAGGALITFVGVDGSGKSTQVAQASRWLSSEIDVVTTYFGTGDGAASLFLRPIKYVAEAFGSRLRVKPRGASHGRVSDRPPGPAYSALFVFWALAVALDKRLKLAAAQRAVSRGFVVVTDRFPQNEIAEYNDGPLLHRIPYAPQWLRRLERSVYERARRTPPDLLIKLHVGPATVAKREPDMRADLIVQRIGWLKELSCGGANSVAIDATLPLAEVTRLVRRAIWDVL